jgi:hypothetical protein
MACGRVTARTGPLQRHLNLLIRIHRTGNGPWRLTSAAKEK